MCKAVACLLGSAAVYQLRRGFVGAVILIAEPIAAEGGFDLKAHAPTNHTNSPGQIMTHELGCWFVSRGGTDLDNNGRERDRIGRVTIFIERLMRWPWLLVLIQWRMWV